MASNKRIYILPDSEVKEVYDYPVFSDTERQEYFFLEKRELAFLRKFKRVNAKVYFILQLGYFKSTTIFHKICFKKSRKDIAYIRKTYFPENQIPTILPSSKVKKKTRERTCQLLKIKFKVNSESLLMKKASSLIKNNVDPIDLFRELLIYLEQNSIPIPAYTTMQTIIGKAITAEEKRLKKIIKKHVPKYVKNTIKQLLCSKEGLSPITSLKDDPKNFNHHQIQAELEKHYKIKRMFKFSERFLPKLKISSQNIDYYSSLAIYYDAYKLNQLAPEKTQLHILCFVYNQFFKINNNLIEGFIHYVRTYNKQAEEYATEEMIKAKLVVSSHQEKVSKVLDFFDNDELNYLLFKKIKKKAFKIISQNMLRKYSKLISRDTIDKKEFIWDYHRIKHHSVAINLRPLFMALDFKCQKNTKGLDKAMGFMSSALRQNKQLNEFSKSKTPMQVIPTEIRKYFLGKEQIRSGKKKRKTSSIDSYKYEYFIYQSIEKSLDSGTVFFNHSVEYKSLGADLQIEKDMGKNREMLLKESYIPLLQDDIHTILAELQELVEMMFDVVNKRILNGENKGIKLKGSGENLTWTLPYKKAKKKVNHPFYDKLDKVNIIDLLIFVDKKCSFMKAFTHIKSHQSKKIFHYQYILACILANATGLGINKMAESSNLIYDTLLHIQQSRIRLETLIEANDFITNAMKKLPIFKYYNLVENIFHGGGDGQKYDVRLQTFKSKYLRKYYKEKGVSAYTLLINYAAVTTRIITGHESHFLFDAIQNNTSEIKPDIVSTDNEGTNQLNFALLQLKNVLFAPCYKTITKKMKHLYGFKNPKEYNENYIIKPSKKIKDKLITDEWPNVRDIFTALLLGETKQSTAVKKLSSHKRKDKTKDALWEYNNILMSIYLLWYIDDEDIRRYVRTILNRTEEYHQLRRAIAEVHRGEFRGKNEAEIILWNECARLIANAILYYNGYLLSQMLEIKEKEGDWEAVELLKRISPIAWQHLNFLGMYDFSLENVVNLDRILLVIREQLDTMLHKKRKQKKKSH